MYFLNLEQSHMIITQFKYKVLYILMIFFYSQNDGLLCLCLDVLNLMLSDSVKFKLIISHNEDKNLNSQCRLKAAGHIFLVEIIFFFWSCFLCAKLFLAYRSLLWVRFEMYCRADTTGICFSELCLNICFINWSRENNEVQDVTGGKLTFPLSKALYQNVTAMDSNSTFHERLSATFHLNLE